jgi:Ca2+-binding RTX toxin-like protein
MTTPVPNFSSFLVNTSTFDDQTDPAVTALADGRFLVTWLDDSTGVTENYGVIKGQYMTATGARSGAEFVLDQSFGYGQVDPNMATVSTASGDIVMVTWTENTISNDFLDVYAKTINVSTGQMSGPFLVSAGGAGSQSGSTVTALAGGRFVVAWTDRAEVNTGDLNVKAAIFNANGTVVSSGITLNSTTTGDQSYPSITALKGGGFVASWESSGGTGDNRTDVIARVFTAGGAAVGGEIRVNSTTANDQYDSSVTALENGGFVVTWTDVSAVTSPYEEIRLQVYTAAGVRVGGEVMVNDLTAGLQNQPVVTSLSDGRFVVTWTDDSSPVGDPAFSDIRAQVFTATGAASGAEFLVNSSTVGFQSRPTVTELADGRIAFAWADASQSAGDVSGDAVRGQIFDPRIAAVTVTGTARADQYQGSRFSDRLSGAAGADTLTGNAGNDTLDGGTGTDRMAGGLGNDTYRIDVATDVTTEAANGGIDTVLSSALTLSIATRAYIEHATLDGTSATTATLTGNALSNRLTGNGAANVITGNAGNDTLSGRNGADDLRGGGGTDLLYGGSGADDFAFAAASYIGKGPTSDRIADFVAGSDDIELSFMAGGRFIGGAAFSGVDDQVRYVRSTGILSGDVNGDRVADWELVIVNKAILTAADIEF